MDQDEKDKEVLKHMENRTQWHSKDIEKVEALRNKVTRAESGGTLTKEQIEENKVKHEH